MPLAPKTSPRPKPKPSATARPAASSTRLGGSIGRHQSTGGVSRAQDRDGVPERDRTPRQPDAPAAPSRPPTRDSVRPDATVLADAIRARQNRGGGSFRGSVLSSIYGLPADGTRAVRSLQAFNGPTGRRTVLGQ